MTGSERPIPALPVLGDRAVLITGGSRGIGRAIAEAFLRAGAHVGLVARDATELERTRAALAGTYDSMVHVFPADVAEREQCVAAYREAIRKFQMIDVLVNAAGIQGPIGLLDAVDGQQFIDTVNVNLMGAIWMMQAVLPAMKARSRGVIVNLSGGGATSPRERFDAYAASKTALVRVTEIAALEYASYGIRVNAISPGAVNTRMTDEVERAGQAAGAAATEEVRRQRETGGVDPALPAALAVWLASDAAKHISGRLISAVWDDWHALITTGQPLKPDDYTLRRLRP
jgi:NAD(P)-dependent dehydrogenase (short-subunit alcohol dehydrogenase family)